MVCLFKWMRCRDADPPEDEGSVHKVGKHTRKPVNVVFEGCIVRERG